MARMQLSHISHIIAKNAFAHHQAISKITKRILHITLKTTITLIVKYNLCFCKKQVFDQQFSEKLDSADFGKLVLHIVIDQAVMRQCAVAVR